jgi:glutathione S-transferase
MMTAPTLTYFEGRGRAETCRLLLAEANVIYVDNRLKDITPLKTTGKLAFGQVPLYEDNGFVLVQSATINRYVAKKYGMFGANDVEAATIDMICEGFNDFAMARYQAKTDEEKAKFNETKTKWFGYFQDFLKRNNNGAGFFVGNNISLADIVLFNVFEHENLDAFAILKGLRDRIAARPKIATWVAKRPVSQF